MLYYDRIEISKEIDLVKNNNSKKYIISQFCFFNHEFKFKSSVL